MTPGVKPLIAGNWKMNGTGTSLAELAAVRDGLGSEGDRAYDAMLCLPATLISRAASLTVGDPLIGGQDCHAEESGAHTGDISAGMLVDAGAVAVIVGHSERRTDHGETSAAVAAKALAAVKSGLDVIICVGETREERENGEAETIVGAQLAESIPDGVDTGKLVVAYEPVWAIGTGLVPSVEDIASMHGFIREAMEERFGDEGGTVRILYGGSMKPSNAAEILSVENVDGGLIGGASLKAADFLAICGAVMP